MGKVANHQKLRDIMPTPIEQTLPSGTTGITKMPRLDSVDFLRGIVMVLMALDHVRDFVSVYRLDPVDLTTTTLGIFVTRWITHFCAPVFVFLAGTGAFLSSTRGKTKEELQRFLVTRGLWLIVAEVTIVRFGWVFGFSTSFIWVQVIWVLGVSMIVLAFLLRFSVTTIGVFGVVMIALHNTLDGIPPETFGAFHWIWRFLHASIPAPISETTMFWPAYAVIPWVGVMAAGYAFGEILRFEPQRRRHVLVKMGLAMIALFFILRSFNVYGDPKPWSVQDTFGFTVASFFNVQKYPPSLQFLLITLGPSFLVLAIFDKSIPRAMKPIIVFGRVPMFYYIAHLYLAHSCALILGSIQGYPISTFFDLMFNFPSEYGVGLPGVYAFWLAVVLVLYPICKWYAGVKKRKNYWWLSYL